MQGGSDTPVAGSFVGEISGRPVSVAVDAVSSLIFIGSAGEKVRCWNNRDFLDQQGDRRGQLLVTTGPKMSVAIPNPHSAAPGTEPSGRGQAIIDPDNPRTFGDALRSLRFESPRDEPRRVAQASKSEEYGEPR